MDHMDVLIIVSRFLKLKITYHILTCNCNMPDTWISVSYAYKQKQYNSSVLTYALALNASNSLNHKRTGIYQKGCAQWMCIQGGRCVTSMHIFWLSLYGRTVTCALHYANFYVRSDESSAVGPHLFSVALPTVQKINWKELLVFLFNRLTSGDRDLELINCNTCTSHHTYPLMKKALN